MDIEPNTANASKLPESNQFIIFSFKLLFRNHQFKARPRVSSAYFTWWQNWDKCLFFISIFHLFNFFLKRFWKAQLKSSVKKCQLLKLISSMVKKSSQFTPGTDANLRFSQLFLKNGTHLLKLDQSW